MTTEQSNLEQAILNKDPRYLWVRIDAAYPPTRILKALKKELEKRHKTLNVISPELGHTVLVSSPSEIWGDFQPRHPSKKPPLLSIKTWIDYFRCYDLRRCKALSYGQIAHKVYGDSKNKYEVAEKAVKRVGKLIEYAESNNWPPPSNFLNKK
jgi:hypothetical protein